MEECCNGRCSQRSEVSNVSDALNKIKKFQVDHNAMFGDAPCTWALIWELEKDLEKLQNKGDCQESHCNCG